MRVVAGVSLTDQLAELTKLYKEETGINRSTLIRQLLKKFFEDRAKEAGVELVIKL